MRQGTCLHMRTTYMDNAEVALTGGDDTLPLLKEELHGCRVGVVVEHIGLAVDKRIVLPLQG